MEEEGLRREASEGTGEEGTYHIRRNVVPKVSANSIDTNAAPEPILSSSSETGFFAYWPVTDFGHD